MVLLVAKLDEDTKTVGAGNSALVLIEQFNKRFKLGTIVSGTRRLHFFGINNFQHENMTIPTDADNVFSSLHEYPLMRSRRKQSDDLTNDFEISIFFLY